MIAPSPIVMKFGGTSVRDADAMRRVVSIVARERSGDMPRRSVVVTSACAGVTDLLLQLARLSGEGELEPALAIVQELRGRHLAILGELMGDAPDDASRSAADGSADNAPAALSAMLQEIEELSRGVAMLGELTPRTIDLFASYGERLSSILLALAFRRSGASTALADSRRFIITDACHTDAAPIMTEIDRCVGSELLPLLIEHEVVVAQGFIGSTVDGITTTIGRGGSDHTGALVGAALGAEEIQIWTDVSGILTADPRLVPDARVVPAVTFTEARELAYFGAKVIHPDTIVPAVGRNIPVVIRNSMRPDDAGTRILPDGSPVPAGIHSVTLKHGMLLLRLSARTAGEGSAAIEQGLGLFARHEVPLQCAQIAESRAVAVVPAAAMNDRLLASLESLCLVTQGGGMTLLCLTGSSLGDDPSAIAAPLEALAGMPIHFVAAGSSEHILLIGLDGGHAVEGLKRVHHRLFGQ